MNLNRSQIEELNNLLKSDELHLPTYRREIGLSGSNFCWLQRNITKKNKNIPKRILELLNLT